MLSDRFWSKVEKRCHNECWPWTAQRRNGYGVFSYQCKSHPATRIAVFLETGILHMDKRICHTCDNPACCNPSHLFVGTDADNVADKVRKGRQARGQSHTISKLSNTDVRRIRELDGKITRTQLGEMFGVTRQNIRAICEGATWKHI